MRLPTPTRRARRDDDLIPLINVVFLLLVFFMLTGTLRPPESRDIDLPRIEQGAEADGTPPTLTLDREGGQVQYFSKRLQRGVRRHPDVQAGSRLPGQSGQDVSQLRECHLPAVEAQPLAGNLEDGGLVVRQVDGLCGRCVQDQGARVIEAGRQHKEDDQDEYHIDQGSQADQLTLWRRRREVHSVVSRLWPLRCGYSWTEVTYQLSRCGWTVPPGAITDR